MKTTAKAKTRLSNTSKTKHKKGETNMAAKKKAAKGCEEDGHEGRQEEGEVVRRQRDPEPVFRPER